MTCMTTHTHTWSPLSLPFYSLSHGASTHPTYTPVHFTGSDWSAQEPAPIIRVLAKFRFHHGHFARLPMTSMNVIIPPGNRPPFITVPLVISSQLRVSYRSPPTEPPLATLEVTKNPQASGCSKTPHFCCRSTSNKKVEQTGPRPTSSTSRPKSTVQPKSTCSSYPWRPAWHRSTNSRSKRHVCQQK